MMFRLGARPRRLSTRMGHAFRPGRGRKTTAVALGAAGTLIAGIVVSGMGAAGADPDLSDIGAWLTSDKKSSVAHVNGLTGQVDGRIKLPAGSNTQLQVSDDGKTVLVLDESTGTVSRIDPAQLTVPQTYDYGAAGLQLASGGGKAWVVDSAAGTVRPIDPVTLAPLGAPIDLGGKPLGQVQADPSGTLWAPVPSLGQLVPVQGEKAGSPIKVAEPGGQLLLTLASGRAVVTDVTGGQVLVVSASGVERTVKLPTEMTAGAADKLLSPGLSEGPVVPILASDTGKLALVDIDSGSVQAAPLDVAQHEYGAPQVLGARVYIPDRTDGTLHVYNTVQAKFEDKVKVTGTKGPLEAYVRDGLLWVNDATNSVAAVVNVQGQVQLINKYDPDPVPGASGSSVSPTPGKSVPEGGVTQSPSAESSSPAPSSTPTGGKEAPTSGSGGETGSQAPPTGGGDPVLPPVVPPVVPPVKGGDDPSTKRPDPRPTTPDDDPVPSSKPPKTPPWTPPVDPDPTRPEPPKTTPPPPVTTPPPPVTTPPPPVTTPPPPVTTPPATPKPPATTPPATTPPATTKPPTTTTKPPTTKPPAMKPPGTPSAKSGAGKITLMFSPASGATPTRYYVGGLSAGMGVTPASVPGSGPFLFTVTGGSCEKEYRFYIVAEYPGGLMNSAYSTAVRPCLPAGKPTNLQAVKSGDKAVVSWNPPTNTAGESITYSGTWSVKPATNPTSKAAADGADSSKVTPAGYGALIAEPPAENFTAVADGTDVAAAAAANSGSWKTTSRSVTLSVSGVSGQYTFKVSAKNSAGSTSSSTATLSVTLTYGKVSAVLLDVPPEAPGSAPYPPTPSPSGPGDGQPGPVAVAAAAVPARRSTPVQMI